MDERSMALCRAMGAPEDQEELLLPLVQAAQGALTARLKRGIGPEDCGPAFLLASAMLAMESLWEATGQGNAVTSFTAGDLSVHMGTGNGGGGGGLRAQADRLLAPWLADGSFQFRGVRG